jgi:predicted TIM-barrel fold metal-dependent hydrolase
MERAITVLGARGIQVFTNVNGRPLDEEEFWPIFEAAVKKYDVPIWMHPARGANMSDYASEQNSKYEIWWTFGWPYETSAAMTRMVFSGFFDKLPEMRLITHHMGAMIPFFDGRVGPGLDQFGSRTSDEDYEGMLKRMAKRPIDYFKMFYADTALAGGKSGIRCGLDFFGHKQVVFATDCPFDPEGGPQFLRTIPKAIDELGLSTEEQEGIYFACSSCPATADTYDRQEFGDFNEQETLACLRRCCCGRHRTACLCAGQLPGQACTDRRALPSWGHC